jgi:hypothetical protein
MNKIIIVLFIFCIASCAGEEKQTSDYAVPGRLDVTCLIEAVADDKKPDTSLHKTIVKDSIVFYVQDIRNCCGWCKDLELRKRADTIRMVNVSKDLKRVACDCNCLFEIKMSLLKSFFDTTKAVIMLEERLLKN